jgi:hypothetical protein
MGFEKEVHPPATKSHDNVVKVEQETPPNTVQSANAKKAKRESCYNISDEPMEAAPTSLHENERSSHILGGGKNPFHFSQRTYSRRNQR